MITKLEELKAVFEDANLKYTLIAALRTQMPRLAEEISSNMKCKYEEGKDVEINFDFDASTFVFHCFDDVWAKAYVDYKYAREVYHFYKHNYASRDWLRVHDEAHKMWHEADKMKMEANELLKKSCDMREEFDKFEVTSSRENES